MGFVSRQRFYRSIGKKSSKKKKNIFSTRWWRWQQSVEYCKQYESDPGCIAVGKPSAPSSSVSPSPSSKDKHEATTPSSSSYSGTPDETPDETTPTPSSSNHKDEVDHKDERVPSPSIRSPSPRKDTIDTPSPSVAEPIKNCPFTQNAATYSPCDATACKDLGEATSIRLVGGSNALVGRLEYRVDGKWGSVCDWDVADQQKNARTACRQLGFKADATTDGTYLAAATSVATLSLPLTHRSSMYIYSCYDISKYTYALSQCTHLI